MKQFLLATSLLICLFVLSTTTTQAQDSLILKKERIHNVNPKKLLKTRAKAYYFKVGDAAFQAIGKEGVNIESTLMQDEEAYKHFKRFKRKRGVGKAVLWTSVGVNLSARLIPYNYDRDIQTEAQIRGVMRAASIVIGGTTVLVLRKLAVRNLEKSVKIYNRNLSD